MNELLNIIITAAAGLCIVSLFGMGDYLRQKKIYTWWQLRFNLMWPRILFQYRDHTQKYSGKKGIWYHLAKISFLIFIMSVIAVTAPKLIQLPTPLAILVLIVIATLVPAIGYAIYGLSKEKYF